MKDALDQNNTTIQAGPDSPEVAICPSCGGTLDLRGRRRRKDPDDRTWYYRHRRGQGIQYAAIAYTQVLHHAKLRISIANKGAAWQNGYAERLIRPIKEEEVDLSEYIDHHHAYQQIGRFLDDVYLHKRIHSSLVYLPPAEYEAQWQQAHTLVLHLELTNA